jgi:hypothetical protein
LRPFSALLLILASVAPAACGGPSSVSSPRSKSAAAAFPGARRLGDAPSRLKSPAFKRALAKFAACLRANGVNVPMPNTSGKGPVFNTNGLNIAGAKFKAAQTKCAGLMRSTFRASPGADAAG